ncbi:hypothetical protein LTR09_001475 [Extremus antarcticus]|uniref:BTB domain-containing protein n=1 Tax=Extremus antarcticus TaxID=702011 RepID=A0AAJ0GGU3_9PEZI|nr:hypothetical protein LTR09_001475 [Extremus antarcticus]
MDELTKNAGRPGGDEIVILALQDSDRTYHVERALVSNALGGNYQTKDRTLVLSGCDVGTLELLLYWIHLGDLPDVPRMADSLARGSREREKFNLKQ